MVTKTETAPAAEPTHGAAAPESLAALAGEAMLLDTSPQREAEAGQAAQAAELVQSNEAELMVGLVMARDMAFGILSMTVDPGRMKALAQVWSDEALQRTASAGAKVMELHGLTAGSVMGRYAPYAMLVAALAPPVVFTKRILSPPKEQPSIDSAARTDGQQQ
ncbi:MAG: hypothetical protein V4645_27805 [Pseudomonadota bacterium]